MSYSYFGNTSLRVKNLLYNFETQLILFNELFKNASKSDVWSNDSKLQISYLELLEQHNLLDSKNKTTHLGTKDARVKSAPLEDYGFIKRKEKIITQQGYELLHLIQNEGYKNVNEFLQIDLISLFFLKATLNFSKSQHLLQKYLEVFRAFDGVLTSQNFSLLPLIDNFNDTKDFIKCMKNDTIISSTLHNNPNYLHIDIFLDDLKNDTLKIDYFKTAKGEDTARDILYTLQDIFLAYRQTLDEKIFLKLLKTKEKQKFIQFKKLYLPYLTKQTKLEQKINDLKEFCKGDLKEFGERFFRFIFESRLKANLSDYFDLNRRYLNLTGIFEFGVDKISINPIFKVILEHSCYKDILVEIATSEISTKTLSRYFNDKEIIESFKKYGVSNLKDLKSYKENLDKNKLQMLLSSHFTKEKIIEILELFSNRNNDDKISECTTTEATIPTIFEYIIAISWYYIDDKNMDRILQAGLSLDSNLLPKSHAIGGNADFIYKYKNHTLMIEATLCEKTNQRRAEMESVSRHLGNLLLSLDEAQREKSFAIFIAPYLDKNVLNDFRSRIYCYFENDKDFIHGMNILPLSTQDIIKILESHINYKKLLPKIIEIFNDTNDFGSKWYENKIIPIIQSL